MPRPAGASPTDRELDILRVLWGVPSASLTEICEALRQERDVATTTVATILKVMADKGLARRTTDRRWAAAVSRDEASRGLLDRLVNRIFDGSAQTLVTHLVRSHPLTSQEIDQLWELLDEYRSSNKQPRRRKHEPGSP
jgi:predicted transcriptional regulator